MQRVLNIELFLVAAIAKVKGWKEFSLYHKNSV
jgi:hypothetical protein